MKNEEPNNTEQLHKTITDALNEVLNGSLGIDRARDLHQQAKNLCESLYSKTMNAMTDLEADLSILRKKFPSEPFR
jgi:hypothetical protein